LQKEQNIFNPKYNMGNKNATFFYADFESVEKIAKHFTKKVEGRNFCT
jgi:hypothetical protein